MNINKFSYVGNGAYCYANSTSMLLGNIGENVFPSKIEVLTGVGLSASLKKKGGFLYFNNQTLLPDLGISRVLEILGFDCQNKVSKTEENFPIDELKKDLTKMPAILGPVDMGYLSYNPRHKYLKGTDHYVFAYEIKGEEVFLHDPAGFPFVSLSFEDLREAWKANGISYKRGYYRYITDVKRVSSPTEKDMYNTALDYFRSLYSEGKEKTSKAVWLVGKDAIFYVAEKVKRNGLTEDEAIDFLYDKFRCGFVHESLSKVGTGITQGKPYVSLGNGIVVIDIDIFRNDFTQAVQGFKQDVQNNTDGIGDNYRRRVNHLRSRPAELFIRVADSMPVTDVPQ